MDHDLPSTHNHSKALTTTGETAEEGGDAEVRDAFNQRLRQVRIVLDRNRALIHQMNENHQSGIADNMVKNMALIKEIDSNISKVVSVFSDLSSDFSTTFHQREPKSGADGRTQSPQA